MVEFQVAANQGTPLRSLAKVASGGELSRISLAIQVAASRAAIVPTLIFDEVDSGIGGRVAEIVGGLLKQLGKRHQVMCVTHLPQVAAQADAQWQVSKAAHAGKTLSSIRVLAETERIEEIARMLGGVKITETTNMRRNARAAESIMRRLNLELTETIMRIKLVCFPAAGFVRLHFLAGIVAVQDGHPRGIILRRRCAKLSSACQNSRCVLMGTPMVSDAFHGNRWDYIYGGAARRSGRTT
jgi:hypothetical protein